MIRALDQKQISRNSMSWKAHLAAAALGAISVLAFAPYELFPLAFFCLAALAWLASPAKSRPKQAFTLGLSFGMGLYMLGVSWVYISLSTYGGMPLWMGSIAVLGFAFVLALFTGGSTWLANYLAKRSVGAGSGDKINRVYYGTLPFSWAVFEWSKSWVLTGFPWMDFGYTQTATWFSAWAAVGGIYLVSAVVVVVSVLGVALAISRQWHFGVAIVLIIVTSYMLSALQWTEKAGPPINIGIVQANIPINKKWLSDKQASTLEQYRDLSSALAAESLAEQGQRLDLVVWPETALPLYASQTDQVFWQNIAPKETAVLAGLLDYDGENSYNAALLSCAGQREAPQLYRKRHLVPFGEYQPLKFLFAWVFKYLDLPMSDFAGWQGQQALACGEQINLGLSICYEDAFSNEYKDHLGDATVLINISEDAWFGDSAAPHQRRQLAQMRARELGRPLVRAANSGPSLFIDAFGKVEAATAQFEVAMHYAKVQPMKGSTPFMRFGSWIVWISLLLLGGLFLSGKKNGSE